MPSIVDPNRGGRRTSLSVTIPKVAIGSGARRGTAESPGKVDVSFADKPEEITSAVGSLASAATGLAGGLVRAVPFVGNGIADFIGSTTDAVSKIGIPGGPTVGDVANVPVKGLEGAGNIALTAIGLPGNIIERGMAEFKVRYRQPGTDAFMELPDDVQKLIKQGKHADAAAKLQESGKTYGDGFSALALSLVLDPLNFIPATWITKPFSVASKGIKAAAKVATVAEESIVKIASSRAQKAIRSAFDMDIWDDLSSTAGGVTKTVNGKRVNLAEESIVNVNSVLAGTEKSAAQNGFIADSMMNAEMSAEDVLNTVITSVDPRLADEGEKVVSLKRAKEIWDELAPGNESTFDQFVERARNGLTPEEALDIKNDLQRIIQERVARAEIKDRGAAAALNARSSHYVDDIDADMARILREGAMELDPLINDAVKAEEQVREWIKYGLGISDEAANPIVRKVMSRVAPGEKNRKAAISALEWSRQQAFGKLRREIGEIRAAGVSKRVLSVEQIELINRLTIASTRSLTPQAIADIKKVISKAKPGELQDTLKTVVGKYDELFARFGYTATSKLDAKKIIAFLEDRAVTVRVIGKDDLAKLPKSVQDLQRRAAKIGYSLALAPEDGVKVVDEVVETISGKEYVTKAVAPFADLADDTFKPGVALRTSDGFKDNRNAFQKIVENAFGERRSNTIRQLAYERFLINGANLKLSRYESRDLWVAIHRAATESNMSAKGYAGVSYITNDIEKIAKETLGSDGYSRLISSMGTSRKPALRMLLRSYNGDLSQVGIIPRLTGGFKTKAPFILIVTDFLYPLFRFSALNPFFRFVQENIEPKFFQYLRGIYGDTRDEILQQNKSTVISRAFAGKRSVIREFGDMQQSITRATLHTTTEVASRNKDFMDVLDKLQDTSFLGKIGDVAATKRASFEKIASREAAERFIKDLQIRSPKTIENLSKFYGTDDPYEIAYNLALDYSIRNNPIAAAKYVDDLAAKHVAQRMANASDGEIQTYYEAVDAFKYAFDQGSKVANRSIYYAQEIPYVVRSFNHPFLGVYPLSYMTTKIIPEFSRALFTRIPFVPAKTPLIGGERIGAGFNAYREISEAVQQELEYGDGGLVEDFNAQSDLLYFINMLFPAIPSQIGFSVPAWIRKSAIEPGAEGRGVQWEDSVRRIQDQLGRGTVLGASEVILKAIEDVFGQSTADPNDPKYNRFGQ